MDKMFATVCHLLLDNKMICPHSQAGAFDYLSIDRQRERIDDHMFRMAFRVVFTNDRQAFYLSHLDPSLPKLATALKGQFRLVVNDLEVIVQWLRLAMSAGATGRPITAGEVLSESDLLASITHSNAQLQTLVDIASARFVGSKSKDAKGMLSATIKRLTEAGYFVPAGATGIQHRATGKWSWLYDVMAFIQVHEALPDDDDAEQMELV
jgi:hypothetical protein